MQCMQRMSAKGQKRTSSHSISSSARASTDGGTVSPSALVVLRLMTSSFLVLAGRLSNVRFGPIADMRERRARWVAFVSRSDWRDRIQLAISASAPGLININSRGDAPRATKPAFSSWVIVRLRVSMVSPK